MSATKREIRPADLLDNAAYAKQRRALRREVMGLRAKRRIFVGPYAMFSFESIATLRQQIQEMLYIEGAPEGQMEEELEAYNPLVPQGRELSATLMFEIESASAREKVLTELVGIEDYVFLRVEAKNLPARLVSGADQSQKARRTSSVHFLKFSFDEATITKFCHPDSEVLLVLDHPAHRHQTPLDMACRTELARDFA